jgi:RNA polymerase sigma factor (TIGR02999 family)
MLPSDDQTVGTITSLLHQARAGNGEARNEVLRKLRGELRRTAAALLADVPGDAVHQPTALVNAGCARLLERNDLDANDRGHLLFLMSRAMHDALVEHVRAQAAAKRGGGRRREPLTKVVIEDRPVELDMAELREALSELESRYPDSTRAIVLRFFAGKTLAETAELMGCSISVVRGHWRYARAWLRERLGADLGGPDED